MEMLLATVGRKFMWPKKKIHVAKVETDRTVGKNQEFFKYNNGNKQCKKNI